VRFLGAVGLAFDLDDVGAMTEAVDEGDDAGGRVEDLVPLGEGLVGGEDDRASGVVALADDLVGKGEASSRLRGTSSPRTPSAPDEQMVPTAAQPYEAGGIMALAFDDQEAEAAYSVETVRSLRGVAVKDGDVEGGISWSDMAVLFRRKADFGPVTRALLEAGIPWHPLRRCGDEQPLRDLRGRGGTAAILLLGGSTGRDRCDLARRVGAGRHGRRSGKSEARDCGSGRRQGNSPRG